MSYVYFISEQVPYEDDMADIAGIEAVKIGFTSDCIHRRISQLQTGNSRPLHPVLKYKFASNEMARQMEILIHSALETHRLTGEWFQFNGHTQNVINMLNEFSYDFESFALPYGLRLEVANG